MKIKEIWIEDFNILKEFKITFNQQLNVIIGENGAGKSTLLEFIAKTFLDLYTHFVLNMGKKPAHDFKFRYDIEYETISYEIYITANKKNKRIL